MSKNCLAILLVVAACGSGPQSSAKAPLSKTPESVFPLAGEARAGVDSGALADLLERHWDAQMQRSPTWATTRGDHRFDHRLESVSSQEIKKEREAWAAFAAEARSLRDAGGLTADDAVTLDLFLENIDHKIASQTCDFHQWSVSARGNPIAQVNRIPEDLKVDSPEDAANLLSRYRDIARLVDENIANLRQGKSRGLLANSESLRRTAAMVKGQLETPLAEWALLAPNENDAIESALGDAPFEVFRADLKAVVESEVKPAFARYLEVIEKELLPAGRSGAEIGVGSLPSGASCYQARIDSYLGAGRSAEELHALGLQEIERINAEMKVLGGELFGTTDLAKIITRLRSDKTLYFQNKEEILRVAEESLASAKAAMPKWFGVLPAAECVVTPIPDYEAPYTTIAYYREPHEDGAKPGEYFINLHEPQTRPRFEMQVLAYHESIPGHHLQIAIAHELRQLPAFRRFGGSTAFVEGWALYTERLSKEMGLYSGPLDRMGMLSYDAWRASRLVVDTGIHAKGWTRERAETFMRDHTALALNNIENEVDRYISWPGQALAYKVGQLEILALRERAERELGERFDIRAFHDVVLSRGAVTLAVLRKQVDAWITKTQETPMPQAKVSAPRSQE